MRRMAVAAASLVLLTGCAHTDAHTETPATTPSTSTADFGQVVQPDPTIVQTHPIAFTAWTLIAPDRLAIHFEMGSPQCYGVDATTTESPTTVTVALRSGIKPSAQGRMCSMIALFATLEVQLKSPLNGRAVISG